MHHPEPPRIPHHPEAPTSTTPTSAPSWLSTEDLARFLEVDPSTVRRWRTARPPQGPPFIRLSERVVMYSALDVQQWLTSRRIDPAQAA